MFKMIGLLLDRSRLNFEKRERFDLIEKSFSKNLMLIGMIFVFFVLILLSLSLTYFIALHPPQSIFYLQDNNKNYRLIADRSTKMSNSKLMDWTKNALTEIYSFNFINYDENINKISILFREDAYEKFKTEMEKKSGLIDNVKKNNLIVSLTPTGEVRILNQGEYNGLRIWNVEMNASLYYSGSLKTNPPPQVAIFSMLIQEVPSSVNPSGIVIVSLAQKK